MKQFIHQIPRRITQEQIPAALVLVRRVFAQFEAPEYSAVGVAAFESFVQDQNILEKAQAGSMILWGCFADETITGVIAIAINGHINLLFVDAAHHRQGIARALLHTAEQYYREHAIDTVTVNASPYAVAVYRRLGFTATDTEQTVDGIRFTPMVKSLC